MTQPLDPFRLADAYRSGVWSWPGKSTLIENYASPSFMRELTALRQRIQAEYPRGSVVNIHILHEPPELRATLLYLASPQSAMDMEQQLRAEHAEDPATLAARIADIPKTQFEARNHLLSYYNATIFTGLYIHRPSMSHAPRIFFGEGMLRHLTPDQLMAVINHELGHIYENLPAPELNPDEHTPDQIRQLLAAHRRMNECRADAFTTPELRPHAIQLLDIFPEIDASMMPADLQVASDIIRDRYINRPNTHPDFSDRANALRQLAPDFQGLSAIRDIRHDDDCTILPPPASHQASTLRNERG